MSNQNELPGTLRRLGSDFTCHPLSRGIDACEQAREAMLFAAARIASLEAKIKEQAMQYLALDTQHQQALAQLEEARKDARRLDSGVILMHERDEFGEDYTVEHRGVNLRAAIDSAMAADGGGK